MSYEDLTSAAAKFLKLSTDIRTRLLDFRETLGAEQFPRAFTDTLAHIANIEASAQDVQKGEAGKPSTRAEQRRALQGCTKQLQDLNAVLDRVVPGSSKAGNKGAAQALKQVFTEKDIPRIQKTLKNYEGVLKGIEQAWKSS